MLGTQTMHDAVTVPVRSNFDRRTLIVGAYVVVLSVLVAGLMLSPVPYSDPSFAAHYVLAEVGISVVCMGLTVKWFPAAQLGLRPPVRKRAAHALPLGFMLLADLGCWIVGRLTLPAGAAFDSGLSGRTLLTTLLVGFNEEWMYRGLLLVALARRLGLRRGAYAALTLFGMLHLINMLAGQSAIATGVQFVMTLIIGASFTVAAIGLRSLWPGMLVHALHDFVVIDLNRLAVAGSARWPVLALFCVTLAAGLASLVLLRYVHGSEPYAAVD